VIGDCNGGGSNRNIVWSFGEEENDGIGARLIDLCGKKTWKLRFGFLQHKEIYKFTGTKKTRNLKSIIDYVTIRQYSQLKTTNVTVYRGPAAVQIVIW
jgi:hypothetical protein